VAEFGSGNDEYRITFSGDDDGEKPWVLTSESISGSGAIYLTTVDLGEAADIPLDNDISFRKLGRALMNQQAGLFSGDKRVEGLLGWSKRAQLSFTQNESAEMNITNIMMNVYSGK
jgi:hypothetical protein